MTKNAVITADIINSSKLSADMEDKVMEVINEAFGSITERINTHDGLHITRGDSIQIELDKAADAMRAALLLKAAVNKIGASSGTKSKPAIDIRIAIGIGSISRPRGTVNTSTGEAYTNSGRTLDTMKRHKRTLAIKAGDSRLDAELETELKLLEVILQSWKSTSAEVVYWLIKGLTESEIGDQLNITQSAVNQRKRAAGWSGIEALLCHFSKVMEEQEDE